MKDNWHHPRVVKKRCHLNQTVTIMSQALKMEVKCIHECVIYKQELLWFQDIHLNNYVFVYVLSFWHIYVARVNEEPIYLEIVENEHYMLTQIQDFILFPKYIGNSIIFLTMWLIIFNYIFLDHDIHYNVKMLIYKMNDTKK